MKEFHRAAAMLAALATSCTEPPPPAAAAKKRPGGRTEVVMVTSTQKRHWMAWHLRSSATILNEHHSREAQRGQRERYGITVRR